MTNLFLLSLTEIGRDIVRFLQAIGIWYHVLYNIIGAIGIVVKIIGLQLRSRNKRIFFSMLQGVCWTLYFLCVGNLTAVIANFIGIVQYSVFIQREKYKWADSYFWLVFFLVVQVGVSVWSLSGGISIAEIFPLLASPLSLIAYYIINGKAFRILILFSSIFWLLNSLVGTFVVATNANLWMAFICDVLTVASVVIAIVRFDILKKVQDVPASSARQ